MTLLKQIVAQLVDAPYKDRRIESNGAVLLCSVPKLAPMAWHHTIHAPLSASELALLDRELGMRVPEPYRNFLSVANGLNLFSGHISFYGRRTSINRAPDAPRVPYTIVTPNTMERPHHLAPSKFIIGSYFWDGSKICLDRVTERVECWTPDLRSIRTSWVSLEEMLAAEIARLPDHFDADCYWISEKRSTVPSSDNRCGDKWHVLSQPNEKTMSRDQEWEALYNDLAVTLSKFGKNSASGEGEYWIVDDDWDGNHHKICVAKDDFWSPVVEGAIQHILKAKYPNWGVFVVFEKDYVINNLSGPFILYCDGKASKPRWE